MTISVYMRSGVPECQDAYLDSTAGEGISDEVHHVGHVSSLNELVLTQAFQVAQYYDNQSDSLTS
jgi:hypothetical protein